MHNVCLVCILHQSVQAQRVYVPVKVSRLIKNRKTKKAYLFWSPALAPSPMDNGEGMATRRDFCNTNRFDRAASLLPHLLFWFFFPSFIASPELHSLFLMMDSSICLCQNSLQFLYLGFIIIISLPHSPTEKAIQNSLSLICKEFFYFL